MSDVDIDDERNPSKTNDKGGKSSNKSIVTTAANSATTLLPRSIASAVSLITQSTSLTLRIGTYFGGAALGSARVTTLTGLELSRAVVEAILSRAGRDVAGYSQGEYGRSEAESILERSLAALHSTVTSTSFFAAAGFRLSEVALSSLSNLSQNLLYTLDAILGSTESSRAIAAIITLIRKEFSKKEDGEDSDIVGVGDLLVGSVGFALLQRWGRLNSERQMRESGGEVIIWDVVILDNGLRADVIGTQTTEYMQSIVNDDTISRPASFMDIDGPQETISAVERVRLQEGPSNEWESSNIQQLTDEEIRNYIMKQLPLGSHASVRTELVTAHTITVDIFDDDMAEITAPPGTMMVEERFHNDQESSDVAKRLPKHTLVFRTAFNESQSTNLRAEYFATASKKSDDITKTAIELTDTNKMKPANERVNKAAQPSPLEHHANEGRRRPRRITSSSALNNSDTPRNTFVKESFSKITQKVKAGPGEKSNIKSKDATKKEQTKGPSVLSKTSKSMGNSPQRKDLSGSTLASMNRPLPSLPVTDYPRYRSTPSPTASRVPQPNGAPSRAGLVPPNKDTESFVTHTDSYSIHSIDSRPGSASYTRTHTRSSSSLSRSRHEEAQRSPKHELQPQASPRSHGRSGSFVPSIYSIANGSETSLILAPRPRKSVYEDDSTIIGLNRNGLVPGIFPHNHLVKNIRRFCRFSSASYGSNALKVMGVQRDQTSIQYHNHENQEHGSFSSMTGLPPSTILLSSYVDPAGGSNSAGETESGFPLVHYLFLDHESKAVVLALRGTWGFEDILTDMTCDYDDLEWQGRNWKVHKGMHASARRLLEGGGKRVMVTIKAALEEFPDYGVIFCGHSLGGGVAALLATMISQPNVDISGPSFVTASALQATKPLLITSSHQQEAAKTFSLPSNRPIHVYAYGPPACMSPFLRRATRGLVTTVVNGRDVVPTLSLGILHDLRNVALSFKKDTTDPKSHIQSRVWEGLRQSILNKFYVNQPPIPINAGEGLGEDTWAWSTLQSLRHEMMAPKLVPPGEVFVVETMRVLQRNPFTTTEGGSFSGGGTYSQLGRPATRVQLKFIRNVETYFGEMKFSSGMLGDHNPVRYEASLAALARGIIDD